MFCSTNFEWCSHNLKKKNSSQTVLWKQVTIFFCKLIKQIDKPCWMHAQKKYQLPTCSM
jgi:hypothetical protein